MVKLNTESGLFLCPECKVEKPKDDYNKCASSIYGIAGLCRECGKQMARDWYHSKYTTAPDGGWTKEAVQEVFDIRGHDVFVHGIEPALKVKEIEPSYNSNRTGAYITCMVTGEKEWVRLDAWLSAFRGGLINKRQAEDVVKILRKMDNRLGLVTNKRFNKFKDKEGDTIYLEASEPKPNGYRKYGSSLYLIKDHKTGKMRYFPFDSLKSGSVPFGLGGYDSSKPGVFYLILINDKLIKFGITNNTVDIRYLNEYLNFKSYKTIVEVKFENGKVAQMLERKVKQIVKDVAYKGPDLNFKYTKNTEVFWAYKKNMASKVLELVNDTVEKKNGEVLAWENTVITKGLKKTSTPLLTPTQLVLDF